jgi:hypothetical protein
VLLDFLLPLVGNGMFERNATSQLKEFRELQGIEGASSQTIVVCMTKAATTMSTL